MTMTTENAKAYCENAHKARHQLSSLNAYFLCVPKFL